jgi:hypothetical protein
MVEWFEWIVVGLLVALNLNIFWLHVTLIGVTSDISIKMIALGNLIGRTTETLAYMQSNIEQLPSEELIGRLGGALANIHNEIEQLRNESKRE